MSCHHLAGLDPVPPHTPGCEECLRLGTPWVHLRLCLSCGHVGCCDSSPGRHATRHFHHDGPPGGRVLRARRALGLVLRRSGGADVPARSRAVPAVS